MAALTGGCQQKETSQPVKAPAASVDASKSRQGTPGRGVDLSCNGVGTTLQAGQEIWFGLMEKPSYSIKIVGIENEKVLADVRVPAVAQVPALNIVSFTLRFDSVELSRQQVYRMAGAMCTQVIEARRMVDSVGRMADDATRRAREVADAFGVSGVVERKAASDASTPSPPRVFPSGVLSDDPAGVAGVLGNGQGIGMALGALMALRAGNPGIPHSATRFMVEGCDKDAFVLQVAEGEAAGQRFRLDRKVDLNIEFLFEKAGFFMTPYQIDSLSGDGIARVSIDCSREADMEVFSSERATGLHPSCIKK